MSSDASLEEVKEMNARLSKASMSIGQKMYGGAKKEGDDAAASSSDSGASSGESKASEAEFEKKDEKK